MLHISKNNDLLLLGGLGTLAAIVLMNRSTGQTGSGDGSTNASPFFGTDGAETPTIFQLPSEQFAGFPQVDTGGFSGLLRMLGGGDVAGTTATKKEAAVYALDAGASLPDGSVIKSPYLSKSNPMTRQEVVSQVVASNMRTINPQSGFFGIDTLIGSLAGLLTPAAPTVKPATRYYNGPNGPTTTAPVQDFAGASVGAAIQAQTKKEAYVSGFSDQYIVDNGLLYWNPYAGFGTSKDPKTGDTVAYQRDVYIGDASGTVYAPDGSVGTKKEAFRAVAWDNNESFSYSRALTPQEWAKAHAQANPNYVVGSWGGTTKKEAASSGTQVQVRYDSSGGGGAIGSAGSAMNDFMSSAMSSGSSYQDALNDWGARG